MDTTVTEKDPTLKSSKKRKSISTSNPEDSINQTDIQSEVESKEAKKKKKKKKNSKSKDKEKERENDDTSAMIVDEKGDSTNQGLRSQIDALSPIAHPLADKKFEKRVLKTVKKASKLRLIKRGVKAVVKALRKGEKGLVVMAGNISPVDILTHIPLLAEESGSGYIFVQTKESLGISSGTKRPTSCVMISSIDSLSEATKKKNAAKKESLISTDPSKAEKLKTEEEEYSKNYKSTLADTLQLVEH
ncbi:50S ribosomal protein L30e-like protein [Phakopsora pachyrhizi]|nr:50S ribosomal protein L30e-like protein [Phakopsora pachyrhizi]